MTDKFDLQRRLGSGHFGEVWFAYDKALGVDRAVKLIAANRVANPSNVFRESQLLRSAQHENIVLVEDAGVLGDGTVYLAMEYLAKGSLADESAGSPLPLRRAKRAMMDVLRGLQHAHDRGIVHRDIKPANVMVGNDMAAKLSDFGLAVHSSAIGNATPSDYGYVLHLAPELVGADGQMVSSKFSRVSDIYAAGVTFYRLVNGDVQFSQDASALVGRIHAGAFPDRNAYQPYVPPRLRSIINRAMSVAPRDRFQSAEEFRRALEKVPLLADWSRTLDATGERYFAVTADARFEIVINSTGDSRSVVVTKQKKVPRRLPELSKEVLSQQAALKHAISVMRLINSGRLK